MRYRIFAGLGGGFGGAREVGEGEYDNEEDALDEAWWIAKEDYESREGTLGILSYDECVEICNGDEDAGMEMYADEKDSWLIYRVEEIEES